MKENVFVYGSLLRGLQNHRRYLEGQELVGHGCIPGRIYSLGYFPGLKPALLPDQTVKGELYSVDPECRERLDRLEGHPNFYRRERVTVDLENGARSQAWVYVYQATPRASDLVESGDWRAYLDTRETVGALS